MQITADITVTIGESTFHIRHTTDEVNRVEIRHDSPHGEYVTPSDGDEITRFILDNEGVTEPAHLPSEDLFIYYYFARLAENPD